MNCKQGDLAVLIRSDAGNEGKFVTCLRLASAAEIGSYLFSRDRGPVWVTDIELKTRLGFYAPLVYDAYLRPIRPQPNDATDEMVALLGKPQEVTA